MKFVDADDFDGLRKAINEKTKAVYTETLGNPKLDICDIEQLAKIAHENGVPLVIDNTCASPALCRPIEWGADIVVNSATKFIGGHGNSIGGVIVDSGKFDWEASGRFPDFVEPDPSYHGVSYTKAFGPLAFIIKARVQGLRDTGACLSPFNAFLLLQGAETLHLRMERHSENALKVAEFLAEPSRCGVGELSRAADQQVLPAGQEVPAQRRERAGDLRHPRRLRSGQDASSIRCKLFSLLANIGDAKSLVIHPASTTHQQLSESEQRDTGVTPELVRLSVGIEDVRDIIADLDQALRVATGKLPASEKGSAQPAAQVAGD